MTSTNKMKALVLSAMLAGVLLGVGGMLLLPDEPSDSNSGQSDKPLYWVAPMDGNYRRDKPGKSPMGMDLVPVYEESSSAADAGTVLIEPSVINNLGVRTALVSEQASNSAISAVGYVQYDENKLVHIHPRVSGWVEHLFIKAIGDPVQKGQPIYTLYSPQLVNAQDEFVIALKRNNEALIKAAKKRLQALQLSATFIQGLEQSREVQQTVTFYAPQSGVIDGLKIREGFYVTPGNTLMSIGQLDTVWVEAEVFESDVALVSIGAPVSITLDYLPSKRWVGSVDYVYPSLNPTTRTLRLRITLDNKDKQLKPNMFVQVDIQTASSSSSISVPKEAVIRTGKQDRVVLVTGKGRFKSVVVAIGRVGDQHIEILDGLELGDEVVTSAQFLIDSESSKTAEFDRIGEKQDSTFLNGDKYSDDKMPSATVNGTINKINGTKGVLNISREAIEKWDRPATTMDFVVAKQIDIDGLKEGMKVNFTFEVADDFMITQIVILQSSPDQSTSHNDH